MISVQVVNTGVCNQELTWQYCSVSVHGNTRDAHFLVKCGVLRACLALLWWNLRIDVEPIFLNLFPGLGTAWLNRWTMHLTSQTCSGCDMETYPLLCSRTTPACVLQWKLYAACLVFWPAVQDVNHCLIAPCGRGQWTTRAASYCASSKTLVMTDACDSSLSTCCVFCQEALCIIAKRHPTGPFVLTRLLVVAFA